MINVGDLKPGVTFKYEGNLYVVLDYSHNKTARAAANIRVKMKNLKTGTTTETTFGNSEKVERAIIEKRKMQYLYNNGGMLVFMDNETYDQIEIPADRLTWEMNFMKESDEVEVTSYEGEVLGVSLPVNVPFKVIEAEPAVNGNTATGALKNIKIETGFELKAPLFIKEGETIVVNTVDGKYTGRA